MVLQKVMDDESMNIKGISFSVHDMQRSVVQFRSNTFGIARKDDALPANQEPDIAVAGASAGSEDTLPPVMESPADHHHLIVDDIREAEKEDSDMPPDLQDYDSDSDEIIPRENQSDPEALYTLEPDSDKIRLLYHHATNRHILYNHATHEEFELKPPEEEYVIDCSESWAVLFDMAQPAEAVFTYTLLSE